jgi:hypothetical protein
VEHPEKVLGEALIANDDPPKVLQPGKGSFDLSSPSVAPQRATVLSPMCPGLPVRCNQFDAVARQFRIQSVRLVGVVADETHWELADKSLRERGVNQGDFMRRGTLDVDGDRASLPIGDRHDLRPLAAFRLAHACASPLGGREAAINERFLQIQIAFVVEGLREDFEDGPQRAGADPLLKPPVAGLMRRIAGRQVRPWGAGRFPARDALDRRGGAAARARSAQSCPIAGP